MSKWPQRPQNICKSCGYTWYPRGKSLSPKCPNCGGRDTSINFTGCFAVIVVMGVLWVISLFQDKPENTAGNNMPSAPAVSPVRVPVRREEPKKEDPSKNPPMKPYTESVSVKVYHERLVYKEGEPARPGFLPERAGIHAYRTMSVGGKGAVEFVLCGAGENGLTSVGAPKGSEITDKDGVVWVVTKVVSSGGDEHVRVEKKPDPKKP